MGSELEVNVGRARVMEILKSVKRSHKLISYTFEKVNYI